MATVKSYQDLHAWQKAMTLAQSVYHATQAFPREELFGLTSQLRRASVSIVSNIAEGSARQSTGEFLQSLGHARGSIAEVETQLILSKNLGLLDSDRASGLLQSAAEVGRLVNGLIGSLRSPAGS